jgi:putative heme-binding domain-containing protein
MIYLGDNWPEEYRGHLFTHNLHGHQINQQVNRPWGSGFDTVHAGRDHLFCSDPKYVALDLQYGPDGAVYINDWYDQQHCHNPNTERWERGNGRLYRMAWGATWKPAKADLAALPDAALVELHTHPNEWHVRTARRVLHERAASNRLASGTAAALEALFGRSLDPALRLRALWSLHATGPLSPAAAARAFADPDPYVRAWTVQLCAESRQLPADQAATFVRLARLDPSPVVRRHLASALGRLPDTVAWDVLEALARHGEDSEDRNIPCLLWHGMAPRVAGNLDRAFAIASTTPLSQLADWIHWFAATLEGEALNRAVQALAGLDPATRHRRLAGLWLAMEPRANVPLPAAWSGVAPALYAATEPKVQRLAERLAAAFGEASLFPRHRATLADPAADRAARQHAFAVLARAQDRDSLAVFLRLLDEPTFRTPALNLVGRFDAPEVATALIQRFPAFNPTERAAALNALTGRPAFALALLDAVASGTLPREQVTAFHVRQLAGLRNPGIDARMQTVWGRIQQTPAEKLALIDTLEKTFREAPLWAYDARAGREHYLKACASCHVLGRDGTRVGPELSGAGRNGIRYFLENILDPNAVVGADFQLTTVDLKSGETVSGLKLSETASAITLRTTTAEQVIARKDIEEQRTSELSLMPEGLLEGFPPREQIELLKFLIEN